MKSNVLFHVLLAAAAAVPLDMEGGSDGPFFPKDYFARFRFHLSCVPLIAVYFVILNHRKAIEC